MTGLALALIGVAACFHATWNALTKRARNRFAFLWWSLLLAAVVPVIPAVWIFRAEFNANSLRWTAASIAIHAAYFYALSRAYQSGQFSQVYPIARGLGVALVPLIALAAIGESVSLLGLFGIALVVAGGTTVGFANDGLEAGKPRGAGLGWAVATGLLIASYSFVDRMGVQAMHPVAYITLLGVGTVIVLTPIALRDRPALREEWRLSWRTILVAATMNVSGYLLVLFAFRMAKTGYVVATRELSIVLSVAVGRWAFGEGHLKQRMFGAVLILAGVGLLVALG